MNMNGPQPPKNLDIAVGANLGHVHLGPKSQRVGCLYIACN